MRYFFLFFFGVQILFFLTFAPLKKIPMSIFFNVSHLATNEELSSSDEMPEDELTSSEEYMPENQQGLDDYSLEEIWNNIPDEPLPPMTPDGFYTPVDFSLFNGDGLAIDIAPKKPKNTFDSAE